MSKEKMTMKALEAKTLYEAFKKSEKSFREVMPFLAHLKPFQSVELSFVGKLRSELFIRKISSTDPSGLI